MIEYDTNFMNQFDIFAKELYNSALKWAYEDTVIIPTDMITSGIEKCRVSLDLNSFMKTFYLWKNMTKIENLPLPPSKRILPIHNSYWNCTKHGSDRKTQYAQSVSTLIPNNNVGAKDFHWMLLILFSEIHRGFVIYSEGTNDRFKSCTSLYAFRKNCHNNNISFRRALTKNVVATIYQKNNCLLGYEKLSIT